MANTPDISFVCCVESGWLEYQAVRMVESLRKFGGRFANVPLFAVTPRYGPVLSRHTRRLFDRYEVQYLRPLRPQPYTWFNYYNKPLALVYAEEHIRTTAVGFLDSDVVVVREPEKLILGEDLDLLAFPVEIKEMGTTGPGDPYEEFWRECCRILGIDLEALPWITTAQTGHRLRMYFNSGVFVYRRSTGFAREYLRLCRKLMDSGVGTEAPGYGLGFKEQASVAFAVMTLGLRWTELPYSHNYPMSSGIHDRYYSPERLRDARIVHYHDAMWPQFWPTFLGCMRETHPEVGTWLASLGPMTNQSGWGARLLARYLRSSRGRQADRYRASCTVY